MFSKSFYEDTSLYRNSKPPSGSDIGKKTAAAPVKQVEKVQNVPKKEEEAKKIPPKTTPGRKMPSTLVAKPKVGILTDCTMVSFFSFPVYARHKHDFLLQSSPQLCLNRFYTSTPALL